MPLSLYELHLLHIKSQKLNLMRKTKVPLDHGGQEVYPQYLLEFCWSCYNIQFKFYATSKIELFVTKNRQWLETVVDWCYIELHLKCDKASRFNFWKQSFWKEEKYLWF